MSSVKDYYKILDIDNSASVDEIRKSYKIMALKWHPDKNKDKNTIDKFIEISEAYQILSDPLKKSQYDNLKNKRNNMNNMFDGGEFNIQDPFEIFNSFFSVINKVSNILNLFDSFNKVPEFRINIMSYGICEEFNSDKNILKKESDSPSNLIKNKNLEITKKVSKWINIGNV